MRYFQVAHVVALMALAGTATASHVNKPITNVDRVPGAHVHPASGHLPHFLQDQVDRYNAERAKGIAGKKEKKQPEKAKPEPEPKPESPGSGKTRPKRDVQPHEEAAEEPTAQALEARFHGPHNAIAPYLRRNIKKNKQRVATHDATVRNNRLNEPRKETPKGRQQPRGNQQPRNTRRNVQPAQQHQKTAAQALEARMLGPHAAIAPYLRRQMKKNKQRVAAHDATVRNNRLNELEPTKQKPKVKDQEYQARRVAGGA